MAVTQEIATVYRGGGRRWLTLEAACKAEANRAIVSRAKRRGWYDNRGGEDFLSIPDVWWNRGRRLLARWHKAAFTARQQALQEVKTDDR